MSLNPLLSINPPNGHEAGVTEPSARTTNSDHRTKWRLLGSALLQFAHGESPGSR